MSLVDLKVEPHPARLRVVRMVVAATARIHDLPEFMVEDLRLATTEACGRAIAAHGANGIDEPVEVQLRIDEAYVVVQVVDRAPSGPGHAYLALRNEELTIEGEPLPSIPEAVTVVAGLADDVEMRLGPDGSAATMRWARVTP